LTQLLDPSPSVVSLSVLASFEASLRGQLIRPGDAAYDEARALYNAMIDKRPAMIVMAADVADVIATVTFARETGLDLAIRGGGHHGAGLGSVDDGIMLNLSGLKGIRVDPVARTVRVEPGCTLAEIDHATHAFGLATPNGMIGSTGVAGITLGGGIGHLTRRFGLALDNLLSADVVLADGSLVTTNADSHPDLFWAIRGGGGNFGVVTSLLLRLHHVDTVIAGATLWPMDQAADVLRWYATFLPEAPLELSGFFTFMTVPPAPQFPPDLHGQKMCGALWTYTGPKDDADAVFAPIREFGPVYEGLMEMPFPALQGAFDGLYPAGHQWYWKADYFREIPEAAIARHVEFARQLPSGQSTMHLYPVDGVVNEKTSTETAFTYRDVTWAMVIVGVDPDPANAGKITAWTRDYWEALHPYSAGGAYVNMMMEEGQDRIRAAYGVNYDRLAAIKAAYDPDNLFHVNQNIEPGTGGGA